MQIKALCLYTFHPVLSTTAGLSWSSGQLITAAILWGNQSVNHCENQSVWGILKSSDIEVLKPNSALFGSPMFLAVVVRESAMHCSLLPPLLSAEPGCTVFYHPGSNSKDPCSRGGGGKGCM